MAASSIVCLRPYMLELWNGLMAIPTIHLRYECNGSGKRLAITRVFAGAVLPRSRPITIELLFLCTEVVN
jgi:hypothetical protein